jgi:transcriptional regulator with XRE-family HTH domain
LTKTASEGVIFGERLRELRIARNLTQDELAERCGSNRPFISNLERGVKVPSLTMVLRLAEALDCRVYDLVDVFDQLRHTSRPSLGRKQTAPVKLTVSAAPGATSDIRTRRTRRR